MSKVLGPFDLMAQYNRDGTPFHLENVKFTDQRQMKRAVVFALSNDWMELAEESDDSANPSAASGSRHTCRTWCNTRHIISFELIAE